MLTATLAKNEARQQKIKENQQITEQKEYNEAEKLQQHYASHKEEYEIQVANNRSKRQLNAASASYWYREELYCCILI